MATERLARAKINLALRVTGQRDDGYHLIDSLVTFAEIGDRLSFQAANSVSLLETGPFGDQLAAGATTNLVLRAWEALSQHMEQRGHPPPNAAVMLEKNLPIASGIGGGSADAAATLLGLNALAQQPADERELSKVALSLGADVPMCLASKPARISGIGEIIDPVPLPSLDIVLANPGIHVSTPAVFSKLEKKQNPSLNKLPDGADADAWTDWLQGQGNDLQQPATEILPWISDCLSVLQESENCRLARMSGSGATCFGLFVSASEAEAAAARISAIHPDWWVVSTRTVS